MATQTVVVAPNRQVVVGEEVVSAGQQVTVDHDLAEQWVAYGWAIPVSAKSKLAPRSRSTK